LEAILPSYDGSKFDHRKIRIGPVQGGQKKKKILAMCESEANAATCFARFRA
jgi:hypothetical protein